MVMTFTGVFLQCGVATLSEVTAASAPLPSHDNVISDASMMQTGALL